MTLFDAYLMVDWCARARRKTGRDSVWHYLLTRRRGGGTVRSCCNPPTRSEAIEKISEILIKFGKEEVATLIGFDFPYGYPSGFANALGLSDKPAWRAVWDAMTARLEDHEDNSNNRFEAAAEFNRKVSGGPFPFWGCPRNREGPLLTSCRARQFSTGALPEYRVTDRRARAKGAQSAWKLYGQGAVGSQALLGIPRVAKLRADPRFGAVSRVWPFETGFQPLACREQRDWIILHAEIFPSLLRSSPGPGQIRDEVQVRNLTEHFAELDEKGELGGLFDRPEGITDEERRMVQCEEGWILGVR